MKPGWKLLLGAAVAAVAWFGGRPLLRRASFFKARQVEVVGARFLDPTHVASRLRLPPEMSLFDSFEPLAARIDSIPGVEGARVTRRWPATVSVRLRERQPVALTPHKGRLALIDADGTVLPFDPTRAPADLPVSRGGKAVARVLARVREADPAMFAAVSEARGRGSDVVLEVGEVRYLFREDAGADAIRAAAAVARDLGRRGRPHAELDARFSDRVFVRGKPL